MSLPLIVVIQESSVINMDQLSPAVHALKKQVSTTFAPAYGTDADFYATQVGHWIPKNYWATIHMQDHSPQSGALGFHEVDANGKPQGFVFVKDDLDAGTSWTCTLGHEATELLNDPFIRSAVVTDDNRVLAQEVADPTEDDQFGELVDGVLLSDFILPAYWVSDSKGPYDAYGHVTKPLQLLAGGYQAVFDPAKGGWSDITAEEIGKYRAPSPGHRRHMRQQRYLKLIESMTVQS